ncbi:unnamed protein product [Trichobilharzia szidati]|nr:unnamed protein product [Trichobilharzia szidati]
MSQRYTFEKNSSSRTDFSRGWDDSTTTTTTRDIKGLTKNNSRDSLTSYKQRNGQRGEFNTKNNKESNFSDDWLASNRSIPNGHRSYANVGDNDEDDLSDLDSDDDVDVEDDIDDDDDEEDEDWVASDHDRKRSNRTSRTQITHSSRKTTTNSSYSSHRKTSSSHGGDRSQRRPGGSLSRTSHYNSSSGNTRVAASSNKTSSKSVGRPKNSSRYQGGGGGGGARTTAHTSASSRKVNRRRREKVKTTDENKNPQKSFESSIPNELKKPRQCFGPGCTRPAARPDTKYCSNECGRKLAIKRLETLLPESCKTWYPDLLTKDKNSLYELSKLPDCMATLLDKSRLEEISREQCTVHNRLVELEMEHQKLTELISRAQERKTGRENEQSLSAVDQDTEQVEQMESVICVTCSAEVSMRHALKHMEKCFQKMEGNTVFCANQKEQIIGTPLFCDAYDSQAKAYCKRLRVVCEHYKEPKLPADTVCGAPLVRDVFIETGEFCSVPHNKCTKHFGWERLRRAKIDLERYRCLIQMDELMQEENRLQRAISQRGGILGMLLHQTIDHNPEKPIPRPKKLIQNNSRNNNAAAPPAAAAADDDDDHGDDERYPIFMW